MMREVNRSAFVVIPKQPMLDWLNFVDPDGEPMTLAAMQEEPSVYLIPELVSEEALAIYLGSASKAIFEEQLNAWITDDTLWPPDRSFEVFARWFAVSYHPFVFDACDGPLTA
jgi:hypothetical protein